MLTQKENCLFNKPFVSFRLVNMLHAWTDLRTEWLRIYKNTLQQSPFHPSLTFTHPHHKQVVLHLWCRWQSKLFWHLTTCSWFGCINVMLDRKLIALMCFEFLTNLFTDFNCPCMHYLHSSETHMANDLSKSFLQWAAIWYIFPLSLLIETS